MCDKAEKYLLAKVVIAHDAAIFLNICVTLWQTLKAGQLYITDGTLQLLEFRHQSYPSAS